MDDDPVYALLSEYNIEQNDQLQRDQDSSNNIMENVVISLLIEKEHGLMRTLEVFDTLLADAYLSDAEKNVALSGQTECFHQLELLREQIEELRTQAHSQQEDDDAESQEDDVHEYLDDQQLEEQIREISEFEAIQQGERQSLVMAQRLTDMSSRPTARPANRNRSFKGNILNPNQVVEADDSPNNSLGSPTSILSADFGDDDVLPIEEKSCVICQADYRHGDEILRNAAVATCNHVFHTECIKSWIEGSRKSDCPCCRSPFALTLPVQP